MPLKAPPPVVQDSWAGPYIGGYFAAGSGRAGETVNGSANALDVPSATSETLSTQGSYAGKVTGTMAELFAGRNWRFGNWVVGGQAETSFASDIELNGVGSANRTDILSTGGVTTRDTTVTQTTGNDPQLKFLAGINGRGGYLVQPNLLLYGLAGIEFGHFAFPDRDIFPLSVAANDSKWVVGYTVGAGAEWKLDNRWSLRAEYRYLHFDVGRGETLSLTQDTGFTTSVVSRRDSADIQLGKIGLAYRLGGPDAGPFAAMVAAPVQPKTFWSDDWAGPYAGFAFGAGAGHVAETNISSGVSSGPTTGSSTSNSFAGGGGLAGTMNSAFAGYNWRMGGLVVGAQVEGSLFSDVAWQASGLNVSSSVSTQNGQPVFIRSDQAVATYAQQLRSTAGLVGRAGFLATPSLYLYGLGGVVFGNFTPPDGESVSAVNGTWSTGYTAGVGGELRLDEHWSVRAEYRYLHFGIDRSDPFASSTLDSVNGTSSSASSNVSHANADFHLGQIGFAYKFGDSGPSAAMASVAPVVAPAIRSSWNDGWAGPYLGIGFGGGAGELRSKVNQQTVYTESTSSLVGPPGSFTSVVPVSSAAALAGPFTGSQTDVFAGYNVRNGRLVWGGQIEASGFSDVAGTMQGVQTMLQPLLNPPVEIFTTESRLQLRSMIGLIGRAGYLVSPDLLLYGLAGLELGHFTYPDGYEQSQGNPVQNGKWVAGYALGAGAEWKVSDHWSLRAEYRYAHFNIGRDLNSTDVDAEVFPGNSAQTITTNTALSQPTTADLHLGKIGLAYRFGGDNSSAMAAFTDGASASPDRWTGFSAGLYGAGGTGKAREAVTSASTDSQTDLTVTPPVTTTTSGSTTSYLTGKVNGGMVDLFAGYNHRLGNFVVGGQVEGTLFSDVALKTSDGLFPPVEYTQLLRSRIGLIGRAGFLVRPDLLLYGLAGVELGHFTDLDFPPSVGDSGTWAVGYTVGAGAELKLSERWSLRGEYRYLHFGFTRGDQSQYSDTNFIYSANQSASTDVFHNSVDFHLAKLGIAYGF